jgi:hypothetical protein
MEEKIDARRVQLAQYIHEVSQRAAKTIYSPRRDSALPPSAGGLNRRN